MTDQPKKPLTGKDKAKGWLGIVMVAAAILLAVFLGIAACGSSSSTPSSAPASSPSAVPADEQAALDSLRGACGLPPGVSLTDEAQNTVDMLAKNGITDETVTSVLQHLRESIPAGAPVMQCSELLADYATLRIGH